ncbi:RagB/SusD family nutrient uptake outer membrane protein [Sphingobacterium sp. E70]|uniref:RagB/SusD family nutrient uptake outer membrane protein n=1 Tax=Sphingobacterium sp. E70 TaxID=2853439 RepID=UPI00211C89C9|nr:RagB/SusD family nutrient uptake outer membrane protein [Sphingobacterium sp. E70]ULT27305.1 RagB/SusD family nutrient uptake outer membrane protein [Sphingobacterium sp. E70]
MFGDVPLPLKIPQDYNSLRLPRTGQAQVYEQVLKDLLYAEQNLPDKAAQQGRVDKNVATALLARVYLTMAGNPLKQTQYYKDALQKSTAVINSGKYKLMDDYAQVFHNTKYTSESIWEKLYEPGRGSNFLNGSSNTSPGYNPTLVPSNNFMASFSKGDRRFSWGSSATTSSLIKRFWIAHFFRNLWIPSLSIEEIYPHRQVFHILFPLSDWQRCI